MRCQQPSLTNPGVASAPTLPADSALRGLDVTLVTIFSKRESYGGLLEKALDDVVTLKSSGRTAEAEAAFESIAPLTNHVLYRVSLLMASGLIANIAQENTASAGTRSAGSRAAGLRGTETHGFSQLERGRGSGYGVWARSFYQTATQGRDGAVSGFDVDSYGFVAGVSNTFEALSEDLRLGIGFGYAQSSLGEGGEDAPYRLNETDASFLEMVGTMHYTPGNTSDYVDVLLGVGTAKFETTRQVKTGSVDALAKGDRDALFYHVRAEYGHECELRPGLPFTSTRSLSFLNMDVDGYTETGTIGNFGLEVDDTTMQSLVFEAGGQIDWTVDPRTNLAAFQ